MTASLRAADVVHAFPHGGLNRNRSSDDLSDVEVAVAAKFRTGRRWAQVRDCNETRTAARKVAAAAEEHGLAGALRPLPAHAIAVAATAASVIVLLPAAPWWALLTLAPAYVLLVRPTRLSIPGALAVRAVPAARPDLHPGTRRPGGRRPRPTSAWRWPCSALPPCAYDEVFAKRLLGNPPPRRVPAQADASGCGDGCGDSGCGDGGE